MIAKTLVKYPRNGQNAPLTMPRHFLPQGPYLFALSFTLFCVELIILELVIVEPITNAIVDLNL